MLTQILIKLFQRDLDKLIVELELYTSEKNLWLTTENISNSAGNLSLHIIGNLNHFIGAEFGKTGYIRQRDLEFSLKDVPRSEIISKIKEIKGVVEDALNSLTEEDLKKDYSQRVVENSMTTEFFLVYLESHLMYHLGQINYHRRFFDI